MASLAKTTAKKSNKLAILKFSEHSVAPSSSAPLWVREGTSYIVDVVATRSRAGNIYLKVEDGHIHSGRAFDSIQDFEEGEELTIIVRKMIPNPDLSQDLLDSYEESWPGCTKVYTDAVANDYCQFHYAEVMED